MNINYKDIVGKIAEFEVLTAKAHLRFEEETGLKLDKMTDFIMKFVYSEDCYNRPVNMTILANTLMTNENTLRSKVKELIKHELIMVMKCNNDSRQKQIKPTEFLNRLMVIDATSKLKTLEEIAPIFHIAFGDKLEQLYAEQKVEPYKSFTEVGEFTSYKAKYLYAKNRYKNTHKKLA